MISAGTHLIVDGYVKNSNIFTQEYLTYLFERIVKKIDMKILIPPTFIEVPVDPEILKRVQQTGNFEDEGGITGICVVNKSHLSLHAWPLQKFFSCDIFSCCDFEPMGVVDLLNELLKMKATNVLVVSRKKPTVEGIKIITSPLNVLIGFEMQRQFISDFVRECSIEEALKIDEKHGISRLLSVFLWAKNPTYYLYYSLRLDTKNVGVFLKLLMLQPEVTLADKILWVKEALYSKNPEVRGIGYDALALWGEPSLFACFEVVSAREEDFGLKKKCKRIRDLFKGNL